jgi:hypothetical protein
MFGALGSLALAGMNAKTRGNNDRKEIVHQAIQDVRNNPSKVVQAAEMLKNMGIKKV